MEKLLYTYFWQTMPIVLRTRPVPSANHYNHPSCPRFLYPRHMWVTTTIVTLEFGVCPAPPPLHPHLRFGV